MSDTSITVIYDALSLTVLYLCWMTYLVPTFQRPSSPFHQVTFIIIRLFLTYLTFFQSLHDFPVLSSLVSFTTFRYRCFTCILRYLLSQSTINLGARQRKIVIAVVLKIEQILFARSSITYFFLPVLTDEYFSTHLNNEFLSSDRIFVSFILVNT